MQILLTTLNAKYIHMNLAIRLLYALNKDKENLEWKEFTIKENKEEIADYCKKYDIVAFSCYIWNITPTLEVARLLKQLNPEIKIILGGPEVSYDYSNIIQLDYIDYIIIGEGEIPFSQFIDQYPNIDSIKNLVYKKDNKVCLLPDASTFELNNYATINPYENEDASEMYNKVCYIETSRGCPYKCEFCLASLDNKVRYLPIENIKSNLLYLMEHGRTIKFLDRTFNVKKDFTIDIFKFILANYKPHHVFQFEITADIVHPDIVQFIQEHVPKGLFRFEIGIQTVNQKANLEVSRKQNFDKTASVIKQLDNIIEMHLDLIVGLPHDYPEDIKYSIEEVFKLYPSELQLGFLKFLKGTPVRNKYAEHGFVFDPQPPYQIIESNCLSKENLNQKTLLEEALELYWNKKRAVQTLTYVSKKYSIYDFLLGVGIAFDQHSNFHKHSLMDAYKIINEFAFQFAPNDLVLRELIAIDYYLHAKIKPQTMFLEEILREEKSAIVQANRLNHHKYRFIALPIHFDFHEWIQKGEVSNKDTTLLLAYNGVNQPQVLPQQPYEWVGLF